MSRKATRKSIRTKPARKAICYETAFAEHVSIEPKFRLAPSTRRSALGAWRRWVLFCNSPEGNISTPPRDVPITVQVLRKFLHWHVNHSNVTKLNSMYVFARQFRQAYKVETSIVLDTKLISEMRHYIENDLLIGFDLSQKREDKPVLNVDDLLATLHFHWSICNAWYAAERQRVQLPLLLLLIAYTSARPSAFVQNEKFVMDEDVDHDERKFPGEYPSHEPVVDSLKYKDIQLFKIKDSQRNEHVFIMVITLRLMKGFRNQNLAPKYVFHERDDNLSFCPILHVLALALADQAFQSPWLESPDDLYLFGVEGERGLQAIPLQWKPEMLETPLLRRSNASRTAWKYSEAREPNLRLGKALGFKDPFRFYQIRRGAGEAIDSRATAAVRNRAMGHNRSDIYEKYYTNQTVAADTESAFLGTASQDWAISLATHLSLTRDPSATTLVQDPTKEEIDAQSTVLPILQEVASLQHSLLQAHGTMRKAYAANAGEPLKLARRRLAAERKRVRKKIAAERWNEHFASVGTSEIHRQRSGQAVRPQARQLPGPYEFRERAELALLLCRNDDVDKSETSEVVRRRLAALTAMTRLCSRRQAARQRICEPSEHLDTEIPPETDRLNGNQCPWCLHDMSLSATQRRFSYAQLKNLRIHIEKVHFKDRIAALDPNLLSQSGGAAYDCPFAHCGLNFNREEHLKNHLATTHEFFCSANIRTVEEYDSELGWAEMP